LNILLAGAEVAPFSKTGGLADVLGSLPVALARRGHRCVAVAPCYRSSRQAGLPLEPFGSEFRLPVGPQAIPGRFFRGTLPESDVTVLLVDQPGYFDRDDPTQGRGLYQFKQADGEPADYPDNFSRFLFFSRAVLEAVLQLGWRPDLIHCNDWQTGLVPVYLKESYRDVPAYKGLRSVYTIHNLAYQGIFWHWDMILTGLDWRLFNHHQLEHYGNLNLMKAGIVYADLVTTVSPRYAEEIQTPEFGCGLDGLLRFHRGKLVGIVNGIDARKWDPSADHFIPLRYDAGTVAEGKAAAKVALQDRLGMARRPDVPLLGMVSRLVEQKGWDLVEATAGDWLRRDVQFAVVGLGDARYHEFLGRLRAEYAGKVGVALKFDEGLAHLVEAGADLFLMPSRFEPSGLNQLYSLRYGTLPLVRGVGGLADTVTPLRPDTLDAGTATGFVFSDYRPEAFAGTLSWALEVFAKHPHVWRRMQQTGMAQDWSWDQRAVEYERAYERVLAGGDGIDPSSTRTL
jgi:starch synthase